MAARLIDDMQARADKLQRRADLHEMAGNRRASAAAKRASHALLIAIRDMAAFDEIEGDMQTEQETH